MPKQWLKLLKPWGDQEAGAQVQLEEEAGHSLVESGFAEKVEEDPLEQAVETAIQKFQDGMVKVVETTTETILKRMGTAADGTPLHVISDVHDRREDDPTGGFKHLGEFAGAVRLKDCGIRADERLLVIMAADKKAEEEDQKDTKAPTGMSEAEGEGGGVLVPTQFSNTIWERAADTQDIIGRVDMYTIGSNTYTVLMEKGDTRAAGTRNAGVRGYWVEEGGQATGSRPKFKRQTLRLKKLMILVYTTDEQMDDSPLALSSYLTKKAGLEIGFMTGDAMINGNNVGKPMGIMNAPCLITVDKETGQAAATVVAENISNMWARLYAPCRRTAVWMINQDVEPQLDYMNASVGTGGQLVYMPPGGLSEAPVGRLKGRPVIPVEFCQTLGTAGDIILVDWAQYLAIKKGGIKTATSIHLRFDYDETAFKFTWRVDGHPWWSAALTPYKSSSTLGPIVRLQARG